ncbi:60S ribosomal protein L7-2-like [Phalaenopsis equestris]|uniref:60S ribosomal protein L7-2-like n=1 Tax=Phalaenopsis equestris TaxID=78828 RepID=UPI0009E444D1|nr:60S ribosomal protein L7-2-like [Phalaenopsis equestris]XP_020592451.1 60S ribosomal protein L7-2-like [Phalaenopsis equestris]XP_020592453.1 60S ribosomal protein L7-2-like [Phalaenopsis equestris]XP_020592454.1 60S ribosomal protein L7-2-like [Phalaenopsis equestris]XP_020592455.1 60S ribosomal protein L7-2-like [Phalaenopsis equestris]
MLDVDSKPLNYVHENVLRKRKANEEWAIKKRERIDARKRRHIENRKFAIKRPEQFVKEYRDKDLDRVRAKQRLKLMKLPATALKSDLLFVLRTQGKNDMCSQTKKILKRLRLRHILSGVFLRANDAVLRMLTSVEPFVSYGYPNLKSVRELVYKKGCGMIDKQPVPLTDNNVIEQALGKHGIICIEDLVHEICTLGPHFRTVTSFLRPFQLKRPERFPKMSKRPYKNGGDAGNREERINEFIDLLN